jgi:hypothetical protein
LPLGQVIHRQLRHKIEWDTVHREVTKITDMTDLELAAAFVESVREQDRCLRGGDPARRREHARRHAAAARTLLARGAPGEEALATLLEHPDARVRVMAAAFLRDRRPEAVRAALHRIAEGSGPVAAAARMALASPLER